MEEIEAKFLDVDPVATEKKLVDLGAQKMFDRLYRRRIFDYPDLRLNAQGAYLRLRDEGERITLAFKQRLGMGPAGENDVGMKEIEVAVSDFEKTAELLLSLGFVEKFYEENRRIRYELDGLEFDLDFWPLLEPYLEIEAKSWAEVDRGIKLLGLNPKEKKIFTTFQVYELRGINELDYQILTLKKQVKKDQLV